MNRPDLILQLSKITPTEGRNSIVNIPCSVNDDGYVRIVNVKISSDDFILITKAPTMRLDILDMAKEIERLNEQNIDLANRFNLQSQEIEELKSELELERFEEDDSHLYDEDNLTPQPK